MPGTWLFPAAPTARSPSVRSSISQPPSSVPTLRPLYPFRDRLLAIEGLSHTSALADIAASRPRPARGDLNNHQIGVADVLTGSARPPAHGHLLHGRRPLARSGARRAPRGAGPLRFARLRVRLHAQLHRLAVLVPRAGPGDADGLRSQGGVRRPARRTRRRRPAPTEPRGRSFARSARRCSTPWRASTSSSRRSSAPEGRQKLEQHRDARARARAEPRRDRARRRSATRRSTARGHSVRQFMSLIRLAFACDLTRVVTFSAPVPQCPELGYPADATFHGYAHQSIDGATSCGQMYSPLAEQAMTDLDAWHAGHVAYLLAAARLGRSRARARCSITRPSSGSPSSRRRRTSTTTPARSSPAAATASSRQGVTCATRGSSPSPMAEPAAHGARAQPAAREPDAGDGTARHELRDDRRRRRRRHGAVVAWPAHGAASGGMNALATASPPPGAKPGTSDPDIPRTCHLREAVGSTARHAAHDLQRRILGSGGSGTLLSRSRYPGGLGRPCSTHWTPPLNATGVLLQTYVAALSHPLTP